LTSISKLIVGGFKSIRERTEIPIAPLTFLFGPNSAGKSAVLGSIQAFCDRISEVFDPKERRESGLYGPKIYRNGRIHSRPLSSIDIEEDGDLLPIHLGVSLDSFNAKNAYFNEGCPDVSKSFFGALDNTAIEVEVIELVGRGAEIPVLWRATESYLRVDHEELFHFVPGSFVENWESDSSMNEGGKDRSLSSIGAVLINLSHPLWTMTNIRDSQAHLDEIGQDPALVSDVHRRRIVEILQRLQAEISENSSELFQKLVESNGSFLRIRTEVDFLHAEDWSPKQFGLEGAYEIFWKREGLSIENKTQLLKFEGMVNEVLRFISGLGRSVLDKVYQCMNVVSVDGDRQVVRPENVTVSFPLNMSHLVTNDYWEANWVSMSTNGSVGYRFDRTALYAYWLGLKHVASECLSESDLQKIQCRSDFINCILKGGIFGLRRYEVKPEVWSIKTRKLASREPVEAGNEDEIFENVDLKVQLYLEDQNGRRLDFHEVGSGISYVMPILASLHSAKTSWIAQPELHLHPAAQCEMGDVFLRAFNRGHFSVVETHSEHLLLRVLKRIRQTTRGLEIDDDLRCAPEAVSVLYFDPKEDGSTEIRQMRVSRLGDFKDRWPHGFFEERGRELFDE
jgi:hypothetical protein